MTPEAKAGLRGSGLLSRYRSDREDVVQAFYVPALAASSRYSRAVGYFTSTSLALFARGISDFAGRGGHMRLIASPHLDADDIESIDRGYDVREAIRRATMRELDAEAGAEVLDGLSLVGRLIAESRLDIKLAFVEHGGRFGIYHEKIGLFRDGLGDLVAFTGSSNETLGGLLANFESVEVYLGWTSGDGERALRIEADFEELWANRTSGLRVEPFPEVARERLLAISRDRPDADVRAADDALVARPRESETRSLSFPSWLEIRDYQKEAVEAWLNNRGRGILKMATGTGKTKTALIAACQLASVLAGREQPLVIVIVAPLQHLVDQWLTEVEEFGPRPVAIYESSTRWLREVEEQIAEASLGQRQVVVLVATNASFAGEKFQAILARLTLPTLIIADEAHNLGSSSYRSYLPATATYRLALSATPERWFDDEGTAALTTYFGPVVYELGLGRAIEMGALCRYRYFPRLVELSGDETERYVALTAQLAVRLAAGDSLANDDPDSPVGHLLRRRAGVLGHAVGKTEALRSDLEERQHLWFQLVYCAEGNRPSDAGDPDGPSQVSEVMTLMGRDMRMAVHSYVAATPRVERKVLLRRFASGEDLRALVAMRCLDEGVDIPDARVGYLLASSSNPRQFIQRRGRILRRADGKTHADIFDYIAVPAPGASVNFDVERHLLARELARVDEFGRLSENYGSTLEVLRPLKERYQLMDL